MKLVVFAVRPPVSSTVAEVAERAKLHPPAAAVALQKLAAVRVASFDRAKHTYTLLDDTFRLAVQAEVRVAGRGADVVVVVARHTGTPASALSRRRG
ncbi:hypothetical protein [Streptosporangium minutum]|uniref:Uncharacterized protein n=1 Tax=Streptosporangium minutum TaxID=569862 RepID=A0A243RTA2_9ACTN|nr:hypothetical protein [Streptosporangium minutum]OUC98278.1 hypothetical protein CA984_07645 [Streptosporangium minutum]